jgi:murein L,D-transpeptidase YcbB/YkuD
MNVPASERLRQMALNMERWRWLPDDFGPRYLLAMIPDCWLFGVENGQTVLSMKTVMGSPKTPSPIFSHQMSYLEINPLWGLPNSIIVGEILPKVRKDPEYLRRNASASWRIGGKGPAPSHRRPSIGPR